MNISQPDTFASEIFERSIIKTYQTYRPFFEMYVSNHNLDHETRKEVELLKEVFTRTNNKVFMEEDEILDGAIPDWQMLIWCTYGPGE